MFLLLCVIVSPAYLPFAPSNMHRRAIRSKPSQSAACPRALAQLWCKQLECPRVEGWWAAPDRPRGRLHLTAHVCALLLLLLPLRLLLLLPLLLLTSGVQHNLHFVVVPLAVLSAAPSGATCHAPRARTQGSSTTEMLVSPRLTSASAITFYLYAHIKSATRSLRDIPYSKTTLFAPITNIPVEYSVFDAKSGCDGLDSSAKRPKRTLSSATPSPRRIRVNGPY